MKKILTSAFVILVVAGVALGATSAFFSDSETSIGNTLAAGAIDLQIDNESYAIDWNIPDYQDPQGDLVASAHTSWTLEDNTIGKFFDFVDLKPGDYGEDTISVHVNDNDAWVCAAARVTDDNDKTYTEPEEADDPTVGADPLLEDGELDEEVNFAFWYDDGDNVFEDDERVVFGGPISGLQSDGKVALADVNGGLLGPNTPLPGGETFYIGKYWCFGDMTETPVAQNGDGEPHTPLTAGTGFSCSGADVNNAAQTDVVVADIQFYAEQHRNNPDFQCSQWTPEWPEEEDDRTPVGAALGGYSQPTSCDVTVDDDGDADFSSIQAAIDDAETTSGETVCVADGTYDEDVLVNKEITLAGSGASATSTINGQGAGEPGALVVSADNVTVEGFRVNGSGVSAIRISGARSGISILSNWATAASGKNAFLTDGGQSNHTIQNNVFDGDASQLVYVNGNASVATPSTNVNFTENTFGGTATGPLLGMEANSSLVSMNKFSGTTGFTSVESWESDLLINMNNFNEVGQTHVTNSVGGTIDAENNWWGDLDPSDNVSGGVDYTPFEASAFPEN